MWLASAALAVLAAARRRGDGAGRPPGLADRAAARRARSCRRPSSSLAVAYFLFGFGYIITATFIVDIVRGSPEIRHLEPYVWVMVGLGAAPSVVLWGALGRRIGILRAFAVASLVEAAGVAASVLWLETLGIVIAALFLGGTFMGLTALGLMGAREAGERRSARPHRADDGVVQPWPDHRAGLRGLRLRRDRQPRHAFAAGRRGARAGGAVVVVADAQRFGAPRTASASRAARKPEA